MTQRAVRSSTSARRSGSSATAHGRHRRLGRRPRAAAAVHRRARRGVHGRGPAARPDDGPRRRASATSPTAASRSSGCPGCMRRTIGSNIGNEPRLGALVEANEIESYSFPQGVLSQLMREIAAGRPGLVTQVGLGTYVDPRQTGGKQNARTTEDLVEVVTLRGREWLLFHAFPIDVAVIRGTTADEDGNLTMEGEAVQGEMLAMAMAARNSGGIVIAQVRQLATPRQPAACATSRSRRALIDHVYVDPDQWQTYITRDSPYYAGALRRPVAAEPPLPLDVRKIIARRSLLEFPPRRDLQPRLRDQPAHRPGRLGGGHHRPARADRRAGHLRRRAGRRQRGRRRLQLPGDDRPAVHVRLLRRRRARRRQPLVRRGRRRGQRQRPRLRGPRPRAGRLPEHQRPDAAGSTSSGR